MKIKKTIIDEIPSSFMKKSLGHGVNAECFLTEDGSVFKKYYSPNSNQTNMRILQTLGSYYATRFIFPRELFVKIIDGEEYLVGYLMDYVDGVTLDELDRNTTNIREFLGALIGFESELDVFSSHGIEMIDINLMYSKDKELKAIDTDLFNLSSEEYPYLVKENIKDLHAVISRFLKLNSITNKDMNDMLSKSGVGRGFYLSYVIDLIIQAIECETENRVVTIDDFDKGLVLFKK